MQLVMASQFPQAIAVHGDFVGRIDHGIALEVMVFQLGFLQQGAGSQAAGEDFRVAGKIFQFIEIIGRLRQGTGKEVFCIAVVQILKFPNFLENEY